MITQACCGDGICTTVCPVQCIRPREGEPQFVSAEQLYIDPGICIDCGACVDVCPVDAIEVDYDLTATSAPYLAINTEYFRRHPILDVTMPQEFSRVLPAGVAKLRVAIVGAGPAGCYAAGILAGIPGVEISVFDRLPTPHGLARSGVAPDHQKVKGIGRFFDSVLSLPQVRCFFNIEVGKDISIAEIKDHHDAIIWSGGAQADRKLGIPGEDLPGCRSAQEFVGWYNSHPDFADAAFDLSGGQAVVIGNGNVALDVARMLVSDVDDLDLTDVAHHSIGALKDSRIVDVSVVGRRGPTEAAYSLSEMLALSQMERVSLLVNSEDVGPLAESDAAVPLALTILRDATRRPPTEARRIHLRFSLTPVSINGADRVESVTFRRSAVNPDGAAGRPSGREQTETIAASLVLYAIGYRGAPVPGLPFDEGSGTLANTRGRIEDVSTGVPIPGYYCTGWIKRGANGAMGSNKVCAAETIDSLLEDIGGGVSGAPRPMSDLTDLMAQRSLKPVSFAGWNRLNAAEIQEGARRGRVRSKFVSRIEMLGGAG